MKPIWTISSECGSESDEVRFCSHNAHNTIYKGYIGKYPKSTLTSLNFAAAAAAADSADF